MLCSAPVFFMREWTRRAIRKAERRRTKPARIAKLTAHYARLKREGEFNLQWAIINCYWRQGFTLEECAKVLGITEEEAKFARDLAIQNAQ